MFIWLYSVMCGHRVDRGYICIELIALRMHSLCLAHVYVTYLHTYWAKKDVIILCKIVLREIRYTHYTRYKLSKVYECGENSFKSLWKIVFSHFLSVVVKKRIYRNVCSNRSSERINTHCVSARVTLNLVRDQIIVNWLTFRRVVNLLYKKKNTLR